jgi:hypothetical protein
MLLFITLVAIIAAYALIRLALAFAGVFWGRPPRRTPGVEVEDHDAVFRQADWPFDAS